MAPGASSCEDVAMKLYQVAKCPFAHRARIVLEEKRLAYEVEYFKPRERPEALTRLSSDARSPTLFDAAHDTWVWDSVVVSEYLEERYPEVALLPKDPGLRAQARLLIREADTNLHPIARPIVEEMVHKRPAPPDEAKVTAALAQLRTALEPWNARVEHQPFLLGPTFTLADIVLYTPLFSLVGLLGPRGELTPGLPHLHAWRERIAARPTTAY
jgi:glutathione S-transferase